MDKLLVDKLLLFSVGRKSLNDINFASDKYYFSNDAKPLKVEGIYNFDDEKLCHEIMPISCSVPSCLKMFDNVLEFETHYNSSHRYSCRECKKLLQSDHLLDLHLCEVHDSFFAVLSERKASFCCYIETCLEKFWNAVERKQHCIDIHRFPPNFRFDQPIKNKSMIKKKNKKTASKNLNLKMNVDQMEEVSSEQLQEIVSLKDEKKELSNCAAGSGDMSLDDNSDNTVKDKKKPKRPKGKKKVTSLDGEEPTINVDPIEHTKQKLTHFNFGHSKAKTFAKILSKTGNNETAPRSVLEDVNMLTELAENLPE